MAWKRLIIKDPPTDLNQYGEKADAASVSNWATVDTVWGEVKEQTASELRISDADASKVFSVVKLRWRDDFGADDVSLTAAHSFLDGTDWLDIKGVRNTGMNNREHLMCICERKAT